MIPLSSNTEGKATLTVTVTGDDNARSLITTNNAGGIYSLQISAKGPDSITVIPSGGGTASQAI